MLFRRKTITKDSITKYIKYYYQYLYEFYVNLYNKCTHHSMYGRFFVLAWYYYGRIYYTNRSINI